MQFYLCKLQDMLGALEARVSQLLAHAGQQTEQNQVTFKARLCVIDLEVVSAAGRGGRR